MATWTNVPNTVLEPGDPIRSVDIIAIKENIIALSEGASGAPKVLTNAINDAAVTTAKLATNERMNTTNVLAATAGASHNVVGAYCAAYPSATTSIGSTVAGSALRGDIGGDFVSPGFSGTWKNMGASTRALGAVTSFLRIS